MKEALVLSLHSIGAIQFGRFKLKSGLVSPFYFDLRLLVSNPRVLQETARALTQILNGLSFDRLAAIPYAGLPIGVAVALEMNRPLIFPRREVKDHGTGRAIEGEFHAGETVAVLDDVITTGASKIEALGPLRAADLVVRDFVVLLDREQGGVADLAARGYQVHSALNMREVMRILQDANRVTPGQFQEVMAALDQVSRRSAHG